MSRRLVRATLQGAPPRSGRRRYLPTISMPRCEVFHFSATGTRCSRDGHGRTPDGGAGIVVDFSSSNAMMRRKGISVIPRGPPAVQEYPMNQSADPDAAARTALRL